MSKAIYTPSEPVRLDNPFDGDATAARRSLADKLNKIVGRMKGGGVIAIEAQWGDGKSWFAQNWLGSLTNEFHRKAALIDAFSFDFVDDPFSMISAELLTLLSKPNAPKQNLKDSLFRVGGVLARASGKAMVTAVVKHTVGEAAGEKLAEEFQDGIADSSGEAVDKLIEQQITALGQAKGSVSALKTELEKLTREQGTVVIMIDELDRCRPDFAVRTLERIKHFFDVPGLVFVLFINRDAMVSSIDGAYGLGPAQSDAYLSKFIHLSLRLPVLRTVHSSLANDLRSFWNSTMSRYDDPHQAMTAEVRDMFCLMASAVEMSLRDVERAITLYLLADKDVKPSTKYLAWPIFCKLHSNRMFTLLRNQRWTESGATGLLERIKTSVGSRELIDQLLAAHGYLDGSQRPGSTSAQAFMSQVGDIQVAMDKLFAAVDL